MPFFSRKLDTVTSMSVATLDIFVTKYFYIFRCKFFLMYQSYSMGQLLVTKDN